MINFDIIHQECRGDKLQGSYKNYKTVKSDDFKNFLEKDLKKLLVEYLEILKEMIYR